MRVFIETSAINWLTDWPDDAERFYAVAKARRFVPVVAAEVSFEVRRTSNPHRLARLEAVLRRFMPLAPTYLPRLGAFRLGLAILSDERPMQAFTALGFLKDVMDRTHLVNAQRHRCDVFLTTDTEMFEKKVSDVEARLGVTRVLHPRAFLIELLGHETTAWPT